MPGRLWQWRDGLARRMRLSPWRLGAVLAVFGVVGVVLLLRSFAADSAVLSVESEAAGRGGNAAVMDDQAASATKFVRLNGAAAPAPAPPPAIPAGAVAIQTTDNPQSIIDNRPAGTAFVFKSGVHRRRSVVPRSGDSFYGEAGAVLNGSTVLTFSQQGSVWVANGITAPFGASSGECDKQPRCNFVEMLYFNDTPLSHTDALAKVNTDRWFYDYAANKIYIGRNPAGATVEVGTTMYAIRNPAANNVTVKGLTVEKYAAPSQQGCVEAGSGWVIEANTVQLCHGVGIYTVGSSNFIKGNKSLRNGKSGVGGEGSDNLFENNEIAWNNSAGFSMAWDAGGSKFALTNRLTVRGNAVHDNDGPGLWTDIENRQTVYENNVVINNAGNGIMHEISYSAVIRNNTIKGNGAVNPGWLFGAGILVQNSDGVEAYGNTVEANHHAITGICQDRGGYRLANLNVHDNIVIASGTTGVAEDTACGLFTSGTIHFQGNTYRGSPVTWEWANAVRDWNAWRGFDHDTTGAYTP